MKIAITGASGFVGSHLATELLTAGHEILLFGKDKTEIEVPFFGIHSIQEFNILDSNDCAIKFSKVDFDAVIHLAGISQTNSTDIENLRRVNIEGALNVANAVCNLANKTAPIPFLFVSSAFVYGNGASGRLVCNENTPVNPRGEYGLSKLQAEKELKNLDKNKISVYIARPFNHIGIGQDSSFVVPALIKRFKDAKFESEVNTGNLDSFRDFTDVRDVVNAYRLILEKRPSDMMFVVGSGVSRSIRSIFDMLNSFSGKKLIPKVHSDFVRKESNAVLEADCSLAKQVLNWKPLISFESSLKTVWDYENNR